MAKSDTDTQETTNRSNSFLKRALPDVVWTIADALNLGHFIHNPVVEFLLGSIRPQNLGGDVLNIAADAVQSAPDNKSTAVTPDNPFELSSPSKTSFAKQEDNRRNARNTDRSPG